MCVIVIVSVAPVANSVSQLLFFHSRAKGDNNNKKNNNKDVESRYWLC